MISFDDKVDACSLVNDIKCRMGNTVSYDGACALASAMIIADAIKGGYTNDSKAVKAENRRLFSELEKRAFKNDEETT